MTKPVTGIQTFAGVSPPWNLSFLDANFVAVVAALNDVGTYSNYLVDGSGAANQLTVTTAGSVTFALIAGALLQVKVANTTTSASVSMTVNGGANTPLVGLGGVTLVPGQLVAGGVYLLLYDGTSWQVINPAPFGRTAAEIAASVTPVNYAYAPGDLRRYGTNTTPGTTDMTAAFVAMWAQAAQTGGADCYVPPGTYAQLSTFGAYPANVKTRGGGRNITKIVKGFDGDTFSALGSYAQISDIWFAGSGGIAGPGGTHTGRWSPVAAGTRSQIIKDCQISDYAAGTGAGALDFTDVTSGSQFIMDSTEIWQTGGTTGTGLYAVKNQDAVQLSAVPRHFSNIETQGFCAFSLGGCNNFTIINSTIGDVLFSANSRGVRISATRWLNQAAANINGHNNSITGCDINPQLTLVSGTDATSIKGNSYNNLPVIDNSGNDRNDVDFWEIAFTPSLISGGTINNGVITGRYQRQGAKIIFDINYTVGSTDTLTGTLQFSLPVARINGNICQAGTAILTHTTTQYQAMLQIPGNVNYCTLLYQISAGAASPVTTAPVTNTAPVTWSSTQPDTMRLSGIYQL